MNLLRPDYRQYDHPLVNPKDGNAIIDGGAFDGRTSIFFRDKFKENSIFAFEPEVNNYNTLVKNLERLDLKNVTTIQCGLWKDDTKSFLNTGSDSKQQHFIDSKGSEKIELCTIDTFLGKKGLDSSIIKLDIEGSEKEALLGATRTLELSTPYLIVCVYHKPEDLWELPLFINSLKKGYDFYFAHHGQSLTESVLYCKPKFQN